MRILFIFPPLKKRDSKNQKNKNPENAPFQEPEKGLEVLSHFSSFIA
jgi:hypothetical protein